MTNKLCIVPNRPSLPLLIQRVDSDGDQGTVSVTFRPAGLRMLSRKSEQVNA